jgi:hypothetical protein
MRGEVDSDDALRAPRSLLVLLDLLHPECLDLATPVARLGFLNTALNLPPPRYWSTSVPSLLGNLGRNGLLPIYRVPFRSRLQA